MTTKVKENPKKTLDYPLLLYAYMVCADEQIHIIESKSLKGLAKVLKAEKDTLIEIEKIIDKESDAIPKDKVISSIPKEKREEVLYTLSAIACVDGFFHQFERDLIKYIARKWEIPAKKIEEICNETADTAKTIQLQNFAKKGSKPQKKTSYAREILNKIDSLFKRKLASNIEKIAEIARNETKLSHETLLSGKEYDEAVNKCRKIAEEDIKFTEAALIKATKILKNLNKELDAAIQNIEADNDKREAKLAKQIADKFKEDKKRLELEIIDNVEEVRKCLYKKKNAVNYFTISFIGKTKAGKSTLHAIIVGEGWDAIGKGRQRTTRYNRVYEWQNIRIIDSPGIGAPGGQTDEEIAKSIIDESDLICFVVTDNNQLQTEFQVLRLMREKAKPIIILLNVHKNLNDPLQLERFLNNPERLFSMDKRNLGGHFDRIRRYAQEFYGNDYFPIIPVQLLATQLSLTKEHKKIKKNLYDASRFESLINTFHDSVINYGMLHRSQTLLGCTVGDIEKPRIWLAEAEKAYSGLAENLTNHKSDYYRRISDAGDNSLRNLETKFKEIYRDIRSSVQRFAEDHWECDENALNYAWQQLMVNKRLEERAKGAMDEVWRDYLSGVQEIMEEIVIDLKLMNELSDDKWALYEQDASTKTKDFLKWGGNILMGASAIVGLIALFVPGLQAYGAYLLYTGIAGGLMNLISNFFKSRETKRREAVKMISESLVEQINESEKKNIRQGKDNLNTQQKKFTEGVKKYFEKLISSLNSMGITIRYANEQLKNEKNHLNMAYAKRIIDWCEKEVESLDGREIFDTIIEVQRDLGKKIIIKTRQPVSIKRTDEEIRRVLQEDVQFS